MLFMRNSPLLKNLSAVDAALQGAIAEADQRDRANADSGNRSGSPYCSTCKDRISSGEKGDRPRDFFGANHARLSLLEKLVSD
jgi:hypothetical protein